MRVEYKEYDQAKKKIPEKWFEYKLLVIVVSTSSSMAIYIGQLTNSLPILSIGIVNDPNVLALALISSGVYITGSVLDRHSTTKIINLSKDLEKRGIDHPLYESNSNLPERPSIEEYLKSPKVINDFAYSGLSVLLPASGIALGLARGLAALNNYRKAKRLEEMI